MLFDAKSRAKWLLAAVLLTSLAAVAQVGKLPAPADYVSDFAQVLDGPTKQQISDICKEVDERAHAQIALVTVKTLNGQDIESYAVELFKRWGIGNKQTNRGVLILYAIEDRRARIEVGYGLEPILPDGKVGGFQREAVPKMRAGDYNGALLLVVSRVAETIAEDAHIQLSSSSKSAVDRGGRPEVEAPGPEPAPEHTSVWKIIGWILLIILILFTPLRHVFFFLLFLGGGFGGGGGSFGGGGGFGGFGGGSSGGGGASSSW